VGIDHLRAVAREAKLNYLSRVVVITDVPIQSVTRKRIKHESELATRTDPASRMEALRFPSHEFAGVKWQFRLMEQFKSNLMDHDHVPAMRLMTDDEIIEATILDGIGPAGWPKRAVDKTPVCYYGFDVGACIWIGDQACFVVPADESEDVDGQEGGEGAEGAEGE